jgi:putative membrane protein
VDDCALEAAPLGTASFFVPSIRFRARWIMPEKVRRGCLLSAALIASQALAFGALAQQTDESRPRQSTSDRDSASDTTRTTNAAMSQTVSAQSFATQAAVIGRAEIELGLMAQQQSQSKDVKAFAERMVNDHRAADAKLKKLADKANLELPTSLDAAHQAVKQNLAGLQGEAFDKAYIRAMAQGHDQAVALFEAASQGSQMPAALKEFAASTLPTLKKHEEMAHSLHEKAGG